METTVLATTPASCKRFEASVLNRLMNEKYAALEVMHLLNEQCFYEEEHRIIYHAMLRVLDEGHELSILSVYDNLSRTLRKEKIEEIMSRTASSVFTGEEAMELDYMVLRLQEFAKRRAIGRVISKLTTLHSDSCYPLEQGIREVQKMIDGVMFGTNETYVTLHQELEAVSQIIEDNQHDETRHTGLLCGIPQIDSTGGLPADGLVVIGAKTSHGKTTFATNLAIHALKHGKHIAFYSMEMSLHKVSSRILSMECGVSSNAILRLRLSEAERQRALDGIARLQASVASQFYFDNSNVTDVAALTLSVRALKKTFGVDCIVVDYLQLMNDAPGQHSETANKKCADIARRLHNLGKELGICVLLLSQINRNVQGEPTLANLRDSGEIAEAADSVIILYNAAFEDAPFPKPFEQIDPHGKILVKLEKSRDDAVRSFLMGFNASETRMYPLTEAEAHAKRTLQQEVVWENS